MKKSVAEIPSFLYFVFPEGNKKSDFLVIDGSKKIIKNLLHSLNCKYVKKTNNIVSCKSNKIDTLLKSLTSLQEKRQLKFHYNLKQFKSNKYHSKDNNTAKLYINDSKKTDTIKSPKC